jgi:hypothetical protein
MLAAMAIAVAVLAGGLAMAVSLWPPTSSRAAAEPVPPVGQRGTASARDHGQSRVPQVSLASLRWYDFYGVELPFSAAAGPHDTRRGVAAGFAHDPLGALLAAVNIGVRANAQWGPRIFTAVIRGQITGPGAAALLANCQTSYDQASRAEGVTGGQPLGNADVAEEAFRWVSYSPVAAVIDLVSAAPGPSGTTARASTRLQVVWDGRDWKVIAPPGGNWGNSAAELSSLSGYTLFSGQGGRR